jgi:CDP-diacylglycerol---serine O-phosphatidyltransferase
MDKPRRGLMNPDLRRRGIYLLPNSITLGALFCAFYAIVQGMNGSFEQAAMFIFYAMVLDGMDGRVARMTHTQSEFGEQLDSLADMVSFGAAPALIMYEWALKDLGRAGWVAAFIYCAGAAMRLARFNTNIGVVDKRYFQGIPSPAAAALVAGFIWVMVDTGIDPADVKWYAWGMTVFAGVTMVTSVPFYSFKEFNARRAVPFVVLPAIVLAGYAAVALNPPWALFILFVAYGLSGYVIWLWNLRSGKRAGDIIKKSPPPTLE